MTLKKLEWMVRNGQVEECPVMKEEVWIGVRFIV